MALTAWRSPQSDATIADTPASCFRYKYGIDYWLNFGTDSSGDISLATGVSIMLGAISGVTVPVSDIWFGDILNKWRIRLLSMTFEEAVSALGLEGTALGTEELAAIHDAQTVFEQEVEFTYNVFAFLYNTLGEVIVVNYIGYMVNEPRIRTTWCGRRMLTLALAADVGTGENEIPFTGDPTGFPDAGQVYIEYERISYTGIEEDKFVGVRRALDGYWYSHKAEAEIRELPPTLGDETGSLDPPMASDYTGSYVHILTDYVSAIYKLAIPAGAKVHIDFHNVGMAMLPWSIEAIQTQVCAGALAAVRDPYQGVCWIAEPSGTGVRLHSIFDTNQEGPFAAMLQGLGSAVALIRYPGSTSLGIVNTSGELWKSLAEGQTGTWYKVADLVSGVDVLGACISADGGMVYLLGRGGHPPKLRMYHCELGKDSAHTTDLGEPQGLTGLQGVAFLGEQLGRLHLVGTVGSTAVHKYSTNGGSSWA